MVGVVREASISDAPLSVDRLLAQVGGPQVGGIALFVGVVRDHDHGTGVASLDYTAHPSAPATLAACARRTAAAYDVEALAVSHRTGHLDVGDLAVVVAAGAVHRGAALDACRHLIDTLKAEVPIWKEQSLIDGTTEWVGLDGLTGPDDTADDTADGPGAG